MTQPTQLDAAITATIDALVERLCAQLSSAVDADAKMPLHARDDSADARGSVSTEIIGSDGTRYAVMVTAFAATPPAV